jgi:hypothetical protein
MEIIERYIFAVTQRLPEKERVEVNKELHDVIEDMLTERTQENQASQADVEGVLRELGHPKDLAVQYRDHERYLISPLMFERYMTALKVVLLAVVAAMTVLFVIDTITSTASAGFEHLLSYFVSLFSVGAICFVWITLIFAWIDYRQKGNSGIEDRLKNKSWTPSSLPPIPDRNEKRKMSEPVTGILLTVLFTVICVYATELIGVWRFSDEGRVIIPFLNVDAFRAYLPIVWVIAALGILKACMKMVIRKRTGGMLAFNIVMTVASTALICLILTDSAIWNPDLIQQMEQAGIISASSGDYHTIVSIWAGINEWLVNLIILFALIDIIYEAYKWYQVKAPTKNATSIS